MTYDLNRKDNGMREPGFQEKKWKPVASCIAAGMTTPATAAQIGVSISTIQRWRRSPKFKAYVDKLHDEFIETALSRMTAAMDRAAKVVEDLLLSESESIRLQASDRIKDWVKHFRNDALILKKLEQLEKLMPVAVVPVNHE